MNDLVVGVDHLDRLYLWRASKRGHRVHIENPETGRAWCQVENCGGRPFDGKGAEVPAGRRLCKNCADLAGRDKGDYQEPSLAVLLGERLAETEPEIFDKNDSSSSQRERRIHRSKERRPKRSSVKYARPFDDDLPSW